MPAYGPPKPRARAWARCASAEMHSGFFALRNACTMNCGIRVTLRSIDAPLKRDLARLEELWADGIASFGGPFLTGARFCAVDAFFAPVAFRIQTYTRPSTPARGVMPRSCSRCRRCRTGTRRRLQETWRDEEHEVEARAVGEWTRGPASELVAQLAASDARTAQPGIRRHTSF